MADDNRIKLGLDLGDSVHALAELSSNLKKVKSAGQDVADTYEVMAGAGANYAAVEKQVDAATAAAVKATQAQKAIRAALDDVPPAYRKAGEAGGEAAKKTGNFGQTALTASYAIQDFTSQLGTSGLAGALNAVQNNIPALVSGLGAGAGLAGAVSVVAVGAGLLYQNWDKLTKSWEDSAPKIPRIKDDLEGLGEALAGIKKQISDLEEKSLSDVLSDPEKRRLADLRVAQAQGQSAATDQRLVEGIAREVSPQARALMEGVAKAIGQAGGGAAVAQNLKENVGGTYQEAVAVVAQAMRGDRSALSQLQRNAPTFGRAYDRLEDDADRKAQQHRDQQDQAQAKRLEDYQREAARASAGKRGRREAQAEEIRQAGQSTAEELLQSEAIEAMMRRYGGLKMTNEEYLSAADEAIAARRAGADGRAAIDSAVMGVARKRDADYNAVHLNETAGVINAQTGGALTPDQLADAAKRTQDLVKQGFSAQWAMGAVVRQMQAENQEIAGQLAALNGFVGQLQQGQQVAPGRLRRNRR